jgi:MoaA/NifB/PqqE/SkfB family radical SAM enzyme
MSVLGNIFLKNILLPVFKSFPFLINPVHDFCLRRHIFFKGTNIVLTYKCNLGCEYCYEKGAKLDYGDISLDNFRKILKWLRKNKKDKIILLGGEPTGHPDFKRILKMSEDNKMQVIILTNLMCNDEALMAILNYRGHLGIQANINNPGTYKNYSYALVYDNIRKIHKGKRFIVLRYNIYKENYDFSNILKVAKEINACIRFSVTNSPIGCEGSPRENKDFREMYPKDRIMDFLDTCNREKISVFFARPVPKCVFNQGEIKKYKKNAIKFKCYIGRGGDYSARSIVNPDLSVLGCYGVPIKGPLLTSFKSIRELSDYYKGHFMRLRKIPLKQECLGCKDFLNDICQGGCLSEKIE